MLSWNELAGGLETGLTAAARPNTPSVAFVFAQILGCREER